MTTGRPRIGVIGAGYWGPNLIRNCDELGVLAGICDVDPVALEAAKSAYPHAALSADAGAFVAGPYDAIVVAAPAPLHAQLALAALAAGKHVFVEKPLALTVEEGERIVSAADAAQRQAFVGHLLLYHPAVRKLLDLAATGAVGEIRHVRSRRFGLGKVRTKESVWWSFATHDVSVVLELLGHEITGVRSAQSSWAQPGIADVAYADYTFGGGRSAHIEVCWLHPDKSARLEVIGLGGALTLDDGRAGSVLRLHRFGIAGAKTPGVLETWRKDSEEIAVEKGEPLRAELEAFLESIRTGRPAVSDAREGVAVLRALTMAEAAALRSDAGGTGSSEAPTLAASTLGAVQA